MQRLSRSSDERRFPQACEFHGEMRKMTALEYMNRQVKRIGVSLDQAVSRGDLTAAVNLLEKLAFYKEAVSALEKGKTDAE